MRICHFLRLKLQAMGLVEIEYQGGGDGVAHFAFALGRPLFSEAHIPAAEGARRVTAVGRDLRPASPSPLWGCGRSGEGAW